MKRFTAMLLASLLCLALCVPAVADEKSEKIVYTVPEEVIDAQYEKQMTAIINEIKASRTTRGGDDYYYILEETGQKTYTRSVGGFAGNQLPGGYRFRTGGAFYWTNSGGPTVSTSVTIGGTVVPVSVSFGISSISEGTGSTGEVVYVPDTDNYYKLYITKIMEVRVTDIYEVERATGKRTLYKRTYPAFDYKADLEARKVS